MKLKMDSQIDETKLDLQRINSLRGQLDQAIDSSRSFKSKAFTDHAQVEPKTKELIPRFRGKSEQMKSKEKEFSIKMQRQSIPSSPKARKKTVVIRSSSQHSFKPNKQIDMLPIYKDFLSRAINETEKLKNTKTAKIVGMKMLQQTIQSSVRLSQNVKVTTKLADLPMMTDRSNRIPTKMKEHYSHMNRKQVNDILDKVKNQTLREEKK